jgi:hypothetical protein
MSAKPGKDEILPLAELREIFQTVSGAPPADDCFATRLQYVADILASLGRQSEEPVLAWSETSSSVKHTRIGRELVVGRQTDDSGLTLSGDHLLSRHHFAIRADGGIYELEDLGSRNGTAINITANKISRKILCDGDLIFAGRHIFVFLNPTRA